MLYGWRSLLALVHYEASPVGPYDELALTELTRRGPSVTRMIVTSPASLVGGRRGWGYPKDLGSLDWEQRDGRFVFRAAVGPGWRHTDGDSAGTPQRWQLRPWGYSFPLRAGFWTLQRLDGRLVRAPFRVRGQARLAWRGRQLALLVDPMTLTVLPPEPAEGQAERDATDDN